MKIMKKALALFIALIMVLGTVPAYADDNSNGITITLEGIISSDSAGNNKVKSVASGETFYMIINFDGNPTNESGMVAYNLLFGYNSEKIEITKVLGGLATPLVDNATYNDGIALYSWATTKITIENEDSEPQSSGRLFRIQAKALTDLVEDDLAKFKPIANGTSSSGASSETSINDLEKKEFVINWVSDLKEEVLPDPIEITAANFNVNLDPKEWSGEKFEPTVTCKIADLVEDEHYKVVYGDNTNLGKGTIKISLINKDADGYVKIGKQRYNGEDINLEFDIVKKALKESDFDLSAIVNTEYTGSAINPTVTSTTGKVLGQDYEVAYGNNTTVAEGGTVTITGIGNYSGTIERTFKITAKTIKDSDFDFSALAGEHEYKEEEGPIKPAVTATGTLVEDQDYTVGYFNNNAAGLTGRVVVTGQGNYKGTIEKTFKIKAKAALEAGTIGLGFGITSTSDDEASYDADAKITSVKKDEKFVIWVNVYNNPVVSLKDTIVAYQLLLGYDSTLMDVVSYGAAATTPEVKTDFGADTVFAAWASPSGIASGQPQKLQKNATLFVLEAVALQDITTAQLKDIIYHKDTEGGKVTNFFKENGDIYTIGDEYIETLHDITKGYVDVDTTGKVYTGSAIEAKITENFDIKATDYVVSYDNSNNADENDGDNVNVGTITVTITGIGNYYGVYTATFDILPIDISTGDYFKLAEKQMVYDGTQLMPDVISDLVYGTDYTVAYGENIDKGATAGEVIITGKGNYTGTVTLNFAIVSKELRDAYFTVKDSVEYQDGTPITIDNVADLFTSTLTADDYTVSYENNINVGTAKIVFTGKDNYEGTVTNYFEIVARELKAADFAIPDTYVYTGKAIIPTVNTALTEGVDYIVTYSNNVNAGIATATFTGKGNYTGKVSVDFTIEAKTTLDPDEAITVEQFAENPVYTGLPIEPIVSSDKLVEGRDYVVKYLNNTDAGEATVQIIGKGNYANYSDTKTFIIDPKEITAADFALAATQVVYNGEQHKPGVISKLVENTDFTVAYGENINVATGGTVTITGKTNYTGTVPFTFEILPATITEDLFTIDDAPKTYKGSAYVDLVSSTKLTEDVDYVVDIRDNTNVGTGKILIAGKGNYEGSSIVKTFTINPKAITVADVDFSSLKNVIKDSKKDKADLATGIKQDDNVEVYLNDGEYEIIYTNNNAAGTATVTVRGIGNYTGEESATFKIDTYRLGDVDDNGTWDTLDAIKILKIVTGLYADPGELELLAADAYEHEQDVINAMDALEVLKYSSLLKGSLGIYYGENSKLQD